ncbi:hypothetical protein Tco_1367178 [Tanacetum coccineum]
MYQRLARHPVNVQSLPDPILFLAGLKMSWEHSPKRHAIFVGRKEMAFRNFMFTEDDEEMYFHPCEPSLGFGCGSPSASINNEPTLLKVEPLDSVNPDKLFDNTPHFRGSPIREEMPIIGSVAERMNNKKYRTKGSTKPLVKRKLVHAGSSSRSTRQKFYPAKAESSAFLTISDDEGLPNAPKLLTVVDCHLMAQELLKVVDQMKGECEVFKERGMARDREYKELRLKCEATIVDFDNNPTINILRQKIKSLSGGVKEHKASMDWMLLESQKWFGYQENLATLELKVTSLETEKVKLEAIEALLHQEVKAIKCDRAEVVSKVIPYVTMELVHRDEMAMLIGKIVSSAIFYVRCVVFKEVTNIKEPFYPAKVKGYRPSYKKEHIQVGNDLATATFPFLSEFVGDPSTSVEALLSKKPKSFRHLTSTKTHAPALSALLKKPLHRLLLHQSLCILYPQFEGHHVVVIQFQR